MASTFRERARLHRIVEKELAYQRAYDEAFARAYPGEGVIRLTESSTANPSGAPNMSPALQSSGRLALFVQDNCTACIQRVRRAEAQQHRPGAAATAGEP
ncbi:hypothetical protein [Pseudomonas aeruginosa]